MELTQTIGASEAFWRGEDAEAFRERWGSVLSAQAQPAEEKIAHLAEELQRQREEQDAASEADSSGEGSDGPRAMMPAPDPAPDRTAVPPAVAKAWTHMSDADKRAVLQQVLDEKLTYYGIDTVDIQYAAIGNRSGEWEEGLFAWSEDTMTLNSTELDDPAMLKTVVHEARHAAQNRFIERIELAEIYDSRSDRIKSLGGEDPSFAEHEYAAIERTYGVTEAQIDRWRANEQSGYVEGPSTPPPDASAAEWMAAQEQYGEYRRQPLEADAFRTGNAYTQNMTLTDLQDLQRRAMVPVTVP